MSYLSRQKIFSLIRLINRKFTHLGIDKTVPGPDEFSSGRRWLVGLTFGVNYHLEANC